MKILRVAAGILLLLAVILSILHINKGVEAMSALPVIVIDAGHGGMDGGAVAADGTLEKDLNLEIALKLRDKFEKGGYAVVMTREDDCSGQAWEDFSKSRDMNRRAAIIESSNAAAVISVHQNSFSDASCSGTQVFYSSNNEEGSVFAESIRKSVCERLQPGNSRMIKDGTDLSRVLYLAKCPAVIVECGFMSNEKELESLKNEEYQTYMADAVYNGAVNFLKG